MLTKKLSSCWNGVAYLIKVRNSYLLKLLQENFENEALSVDESKMADHRRVDYLNLLYYVFCFVISANIVNTDGLPRKEQ